MPDSVLFIVDGALDRPLLHSQGLPLLRHLADQGLRCLILSFENAATQQPSPLSRDLQKRGIHWETVQIPAEVSGLQRLIMIAHGLLRAWQLCRQKTIHIAHCRSYRAGMIGAFVKRLLGVAFVFDMRGFLIDELVADGRWQVGTLKYLLGKWFEQWLVLEADAIITTSPQFSALVWALPYFPRADATRVVSIPNCADLQKFFINEEVRQTMRARLGWQDRYVVVFAGVADRYQRSYQDLFRFFNALKQCQPNALLAIFTYDDNRPLREAAQALALPATDIFFGQAPSSDMPHYLNAADAGLAFFRVTSQVHAIASPIKFAEYLACGLPVAINVGVGDTGRILNEYQVGVAINFDDATTITQAVNHLLTLSAETGLRERCRQAAHNELSLEIAIERYTTVYQHIKPSQSE